jgi:hypothetical protein
MKISMGADDSALFTLSSHGSAPVMTPTSVPSCAREEAMWAGDGPAYLAMAYVAYCGLSASAAVGCALKPGLLRPTRTHLEHPAAQQHGLSPIRRRRPQAHEQAARQADERLRHPELRGHGGMAPGSCPRWKKAVVEESPDRGHGTCTAPRSRVGTCRRCPVLASQVLRQRSCAKAGRATACVHTHLSHVGTDLR